MTEIEFNTKYQAIIPPMWDGLAFDIPEITEMLDEVFETIVVNLPQLQILQIKVKWGRARVYLLCPINTETEEYVIKSETIDAIEAILESRIDTLLTYYDLKDGSIGRNRV